MALGTNRDYKTAGRRALKNLAKHKQLMNVFIRQGLSREESSRKALTEMEGVRAMDRNARKQTGE